jgi:hypothetical protein
MAKSKFSVTVVRTDGVIDLDATLALASKAITLHVMELEEQERKIALAIDEYFGKHSEKTLPMQAVISSVTTTLVKDLADFSKVSSQVHEYISSNIPSKFITQKGIGGGLSKTCVD